MCCCLSYKDTILKANHSTTKWVVRASWLLLILQRYYFESESQLVNRLNAQELRCCLSYKDTILKANHSLFDNNAEVVRAVAYPTKILFWKRITAVIVSNTLGLELLLILQRYYFESESQLLQAHRHYLLAVAYPTKILFWKRITAYNGAWIR